ncbi:hypothetical protein LTR70_005465 [Exophiala xenobiotica]|uniref:Uncharacterized protein n=1 Tax=Lithohypha guttulata TaxID=1690604 RepID=A0ABR0KA60_9EURO|nr:hypothetical protein LTR24_005207 [Lithohypha guttulata]KAK5318442.1 hypothetical protein LTR70_005465 [Exophiala xenobiotica]
MLYNNNLSTGSEVGMHLAVVDVARLDQALNDFERNLEAKLRLRPWDSTAEITVEPDAVFEKLSVIMRLRYLHARLLLHRTVLRALTDKCEEHQIDSGVRLGRFAGGLAQQSLSLCMSTAAEIVEIVYEMSALPLKLGSWWFSTYYTFHASLVLVICLLLHYGHFSIPQAIPHPIWNNDEISETAKTLIQGKQAIAQVGRGTRSSQRICRTLSKMIQACTSIAFASSVDASPLQALLARVEDMSHNPTAGAANMADFDVPRIGDIYQAIDIDFPDIGTQSELDIFANFGGFDVGLTGLMAP